MRLYLTFFSLNLKLISLGCYLFINSGYIYCASSIPLALRDAPDTARILCWNLTSEPHRQPRAKDLPQVPTWRLERDFNPQPFGRKKWNLPTGHHAPHLLE